MHKLSCVLACLVIGCLATLVGCSKASKTATEAAGSPQANASALTEVASPTPTASEAGAASAAPGASGSPTINVTYTDINGSFAQQAIVDEAKLGAFDSASGQFKPNDPITRGEYAKWLVMLNNIYFNDDPTRQFRLPQSPETTFVDVPQSNQYWKYIQALSDAGYVVGVDATHFAPDRLLTRQEMVAIKYQVDTGYKKTPDPSDNATDLPEFVDANQVSKLYITMIIDDLHDGGTHNIARIWGKTVYLHPTQSLTRAEAAASLSDIADRNVTDVVTSSQ
jgi:S-layer homology domain